MTGYLASQLSVENISLFNTGASYQKYDLVDYEYYTGNAIYPTGVGAGLFAWFNIDNRNNLAIDSSGYVSTWYNSAPNHSTENLSIYVNLDKPYYNFTKNSLDFTASNIENNFTKNQLFYNSFNIPSSNKDRNWFVVFEFNSLYKGDYKTSTSAYPNQSCIIETNNNNPNGSYTSSGFFGVYGDNSQLVNSNIGALSQSQSLVVDGQGSLNPSLNTKFSSSQLIKKKSIISIVKNNTTNNLRIRDNGYEVLNTNCNYFHTGAIDLQIGASARSHASASDQYIGGLYNFDGSNISYHEIIGIDTTLTDDQIIQIEKYLFNKHFTNQNGLYIASDAFLASDYRYSPINLVGSTFLNKNIDSLFNKTYGCSANFSTKALKISYGDGYYVNTITNINNLISTFSLKYDGLTDKQSAALAGFFQNSFQAVPETPFDSYKNVDIKLFYPYKDNAKIYFETLESKSVNSNLNSITINCRSPYDSSLDYRGFLVTGYKNYDSNISSSKDDVVFFKPNNTWYWYTGAGLNAPISQYNSPTGVYSKYTTKFYFKPDIDYSIQLAPRFLKNELDNSAPSYQQNGINKNILELSYNFSDRSDKETSALLKFLDQKAGFKIFEIDLPEPYNKAINVYCPEWNHTYKFKDCHTVTTKMFEFKGYLPSDVYFNTLLSL